MSSSFVYDEAYIALRPKCAWQSLHDRSTAWFACQGRQNRLLLLTFLTIIEFIVVQQIYPIAIPGIIRKTQIALSRGALKRKEDR